MDLSKYLKPAPGDIPSAMLSILPFTIYDDDAILPFAIYDDDAILQYTLYDEDLLPFNMTEDNIISIESKINSWGREPNNSLQISSYISLQVLESAISEDLANIYASSSRRKGKRKLVFSHYIPKN
jgi:hypothetical protein